MLKFKNIIAVFISACLLLVVPASALGYAKEASLFLIPDKASYFDPEFLTLDVIIGSDDMIINAAQVSLNFPPDKLKIVNSSMDNSWCEILVDESLDNNNGTYNLICGSPLPQADSLLPTVRLTFSKLSSGWAQLTFNSNSSVRLHNSQGTEALGDREVHYLYLVK
jgi:hypothetical protein